MLRIVEFFKYFDRRRIFLSEELCRQIDDFIEKFRKPAFDFSLYLDEAQYDQSTARQKREAWITAWESVSEADVPKARESLEREFRRLLGVPLHEDNAREPLQD